MIESVTSAKVAGFHFGLRSLSMRTTTEMHFEKRRVILTGSTTLMEVLVSEESLSQPVLHSEDFGVAHFAPFSDLSMGHFERCWTHFAKSRCLFFRPL